MCGALAHAHWIVSQGGTLCGRGRQGRKGLSLENTRCEPESRAAFREVFQLHFRLCFVLLFFLLLSLRGSGRETHRDTTGSLTENKTHARRCRHGGGVLVCVCLCVQQLVASCSGIAMYLHLYLLHGSSCIQLAIKHLKQNPGSETCNCNRQSYSTALRLLQLCSSTAGSS